MGNHLEWKMEYHLINVATCPEFNAGSNCGFIRRLKYIAYYSDGG